MNCSDSLGSDLARIRLCLHKALLTLAGDRLMEPAADIRGYRRLVFFDFGLELPVYHFKSCAVLRGMQDVGWMDSQLSQEDSA